MTDLAHRYEEAKRQLQSIAGDVGALVELRQRDPDGYNLAVAVAFDLDARRVGDVFPGEAACDRWFVSGPVESVLDVAALEDAPTHDLAIARAVDALGLHALFMASIAGNGAG